MEMSFSPYATESDHVLIKDSKVYCSIQGIVYKYLPIADGNSSLPKAGYMREIYKGNDLASNY